MKCDELQTISSGEIYNKIEYEGSCITDDLYYPKSEADKVIEFWKNESHEHYERWFNLNKQYEGWLGKVCRCERAERELRHQKYKRCLAMAKWCGDEAYIYKHGSEYDEDLAAWFGKWHKRWLEFAEKFKEAK